MSNVSPDKICAKHYSVSDTGVLYDSVNDNCSKPCTGYDHGPNSQYPCNEFVSKLHVIALRDGICAYEVNALSGNINTTVLQIGKTCSSCGSEPESGKDCEFYVSYADYDRHACAWNIRSQRRLDAVDGKLSELSEDETFCLGCSGDFDHAKCKDGEGYYDVRYVVDEVCANRAQIENKKKKGKQPAGLELSCLSCSSKKCGQRNCNNPFYSSTFHWASTLSTPELGVPRTSSLAS